MHIDEVEECCVCDDERTMTICPGCGVVMCDHCVEADHACCGTED